MWLEKVESFRPSVRAAANTKLRIESFVSLTVENGGHKTATVFGNVLKFATKLILLTTFTDKEIMRIETHSRQVVPKSGHAVSIGESSENQGAEI